jgi:hypothetical protein
MGWHVEGEMGGIWLHPIKLMDGFTASVSLGNDTFCLDQAETFTNYPFANKHQFLVKEAGLEVERLQFVPDGKEGMTILFRVKNVDTSDKTIQFQFHAFVDLMPVWLGERTQLIDYPDAISFDSNTATFSAKDQGNPWFTVWGTKEGLLPQPSQALNCNYSPKGKGTSSGFTLEMKLPGGSEQVVPVFIAGSTASELKALETLADLKKNLEPDWFAKKKRYEQLAQQAEIQVPDPELQRTYRWIKYNSDWLVREVPGIGRGFGAGLQDYPWWFGVDN